MQNYAMLEKKCSIQSRVCLQDVLEKCLIQLESVYEMY